MKVKHLLVVIALVTGVIALLFTWFYKKGADSDWTLSLVEATVDKVVVHGPPKDPFKVPVSLSTDARGNIYVADSDNHRIRVFSPNWELIDQFGSFGNQEGEFGYPVAVGISSAGEIFVSEAYNNRVQVLTAEGRFLRWFASEESPIKAPSALFVDQADRVYVFDRSDQVIKIYSKDGQFLQLIDGREGRDQGLRYVMGLALTQEGHLVVSDSGNRNIKIIDRQGKIIEVLSGNINGIPPLSLPRGIAIIDKDLMAVADGLSRKVYLLEKKVSQWNYIALEHDFLLPDGVTYKDGKLYITDRGNNTVVALDIPKGLGKRD